MLLFLFLKGIIKIFIKINFIKNYFEKNFLNNLNKFFLLK